MSAPRRPPFARLLAEFGRCGGECWIYHGTDAWPAARARNAVVTRSGVGAPALLLPPGAQAGAVDWSATRSLEILACEAGASRDPNARALAVECLLSGAIVVRAITARDGGRMTTYRATAEARRAA